MSVEMKTLTIGGTTYEIVDEVAREAAKKFIGENPTGGVENDTPAFWVSRGPGYCWISEPNQIVNQPDRYGFLINYTSDTDVFQIFRDQTDGDTYFRSGDHVNNWFRHWATVATSADIPGMATANTLGTVMVDGNNGIGINTETGNLFIKGAETNEIDGKEHSYKPITPDNLDYAVKAALVDNAHDLTDSERTAALAWLGSQSKITGTAGQMVGFDASGKPVAQEVPNDVYVFNIIYDRDAGVYSTDKTFAEVKTAADAGKVCVACVLDDASNPSLRTHYTMDQAYIYYVSFERRNGSAIEYLYFNNDNTFSTNSTNLLSIRRNDTDSPWCPGINAAFAANSYQAPATSLLRNSKIVSADTNPTVNGEINWTYK